MITTGLRPYDGNQALENTTRTERRRLRNKEILHARLNNLWSQGHSEYNVKLRFSRHWSNVNACCDVGGVT